MQYALYKDNIFQRFAQFAGDPESFTGHPTKGTWRWVPVVEETPPTDRRFYRRVEGLKDDQYVKGWEPIAMEDARAILSAQIEDKARAVRDIGITVNGAPVRTTPDAVGEMIAGEAVFRGGRSGQIDHRFPDGTWRKVGQAEVAAMIQAAGAHWAAVKARHKALDEAVAAAQDIAALEGLDIDQGWPS